MNMISLLRNYSTYICLALVMCLGLYFVYQNTFIQDDAYIAFNYAKWFSRGYGLVWYPGSDEYGYTSFLYTLLLGLAMSVGLSAEAISPAINTVSFIGVLLVTYRLATSMLAHRWLALLPLVVLATHHSFTAYGTGGLETMFFTLMVLCFYWRLQQWVADGDRAVRHHYYWLGGLAAASLLIRLDAAIILLPGYFWLWLAKRDMSLMAAWWRMRLAMFIPLAVLVLLFAHSWWMYGQILPNTAAVKLSGGNVVERGLRYYHVYGLLHHYIPVWVLAGVMLLCTLCRAWRRVDGVGIALLLVVYYWLAYILFIGGDFMEFRFLVPALPFYCLACYQLVAASIPRLKWIAMLAITALLVVGNINHSKVFRTDPTRQDFIMRPVRFSYTAIETTDMLHQWVNFHGFDWADIGRGLRSLLVQDRYPPVILASGPVGAISFYSDLPIFDLLGLNNKAVVKHHHSFLPRAGHEMIATADIVSQSRVNVNIFHPQLVCEWQGQYTWLRSAIRPNGFIKKEAILMPFSKHCYVLADYLLPHPYIEELLREKKILRTRDIVGRLNCPRKLCFP